MNLCIKGDCGSFPAVRLNPGNPLKKRWHGNSKKSLILHVIAATPLITVKHQYPDLAVQLNVFLVEHFSGDAKSCEGQPFKWVNTGELANHAFPTANRPIITAAQLPPYYAILDDVDESQLLTNLHKILIRGIKLIQLRLKTLHTDAIKNFIEQAYPLCKRQGASLLINSAVKNAEDFAVDGIHLTSRHLMSITKRPAFPRGTSEQAHWVAASCHNLLELQHAQKIGVDFTVLAPVLATKTHPETEPLGWEQFAKLVSKTNLPVYALGGLSESSLDMTRQAGGQGVAAIRAFLE